MFSFQPHPLLPGGHLQTLAGSYLPWPEVRLTSRRRSVTLNDGDAIVLHDSRPADWHDGDPAVILIHGLAGCHASGYMMRTAAKLLSQGMRVFRMDMRGCGAGEGIARRTTHCGRSGDAAAAIDSIASVCPGSATYLVGFSLGGVIALNLAGEIADRPCGNLAGVLAVGPAIDLPANRRHFETLRARPYDRFFVRQLWRQVIRRAARMTDPWPVDLSRRPRYLCEFDHRITAPLGGFASADEYYHITSPGPKLPSVAIPTLILAAENDPVVCVEPLKRCRHSSAVEVVITRSGGHLGYVTTRRNDPDRRWLEWRIVDWILARSTNHRQRDLAVRT